MSLWCVIVKLRSRSITGPFPVHTNSFLFKYQRPGPGANIKFGLPPLTHRVPKWLLRPKLKELMLRGSLSGEPCYASILWADNKGNSSEIFSSLSFFISSCEAREVGAPVPAAPSAPWLLLLSGLVNRNDLTFLEMFFNKRSILWCIMGHLTALAAHTSERPY